MSLVHWLVQSHPLLRQISFCCASRYLFGKCVSIIVYVHVFFSNKNKLSCAYIFLMYIFRIFAPPSVLKYPKIHIKLDAWKHSYCAIQSLLWLI